MTAFFRKFVLTAHITSSVGWLGTVVSFLALSITGLTTQNFQMARVVYPAMELIGWYVIVPLSLASFLTGLIQSLGTSWGLFRHYWVLIKFILTIIAIGLLLLHMAPTTRLSDAAIEKDLSTTDLRDLRIQVMADAAGAVLLLIVNITLSVYKPRGLTRSGRRKEQLRNNEMSTTPLWVKAFTIIFICLLLLFEILKHVGSGMIASNQNIIQLSQFFIDQIRERKP